MANLWTYDQRFNGLSTGDLNGQNGWTGSTEFEVATTGTPYEGTKHVKIISTGVDNAIEKAITSVSYGTLYVSVKSSDVTLENGRFRLMTDATHCAIFLMASVSSTIKVYNGDGSWDTLTASVNDTYYRIGIAFEHTTGGWEGLSQYHFKCNVNGGAWTAEKAFFQPTAGGITSIILGSYPDLASTIYYDFISPNYLVPSANTYQVKTGAGLTPSMSYGGDQANHTETRVAQSFYTKEKGILTSIDIYSCKGGSPTDLSYYDIYASDGLKPTGSPLNLTRGVISNSSLITQPPVAVYHIPVVTSELASETQYWMVASRSGADDGTNYPVIVNGNTYSPLPFVQYNGSTGLWGSDTHQAWNIVFNFQKSTTPSLTNTNSLALVRASSQCASITDAAQTGLGITGDISVEAWVNLNELPSTGAYSIAGKSGVSNNNSWMFWLNTNQKLFFEFFSNGSSTVTSAVSTAVGAVSGDVGNWIHLAVTADVSAGGSGLTFYKNGVALGTTVETNNATSIFDGTSDVTIGWSGTAGTNMNGKIDEVRIWNDIRTTQEIFDNYRKQLIGNEQGLVGYWQLNGNANDATANANNLTLVGSPAYSTTVPFTHQTDIFYSTFGDGSTKDISSSDWDTVHNKPTGGYAYNAIDQDYMSLVGWEGANRWIQRGFFVIDTSALSASARIISAKFYFKTGAQVYDYDNDGDDYIALVNSTQANPDLLVLGDYSKCGLVDNPPIGSDTIDLSTMATTTPYCLTLNTTGINWISKTGKTLFGIREGHDILNHAFAPAANWNGFAAYTSYNADFTLKPRLEVTHGPASTTLTGTITESTTESNIVAGGKTIILTMNGDTWTA